MNATLLNQEIKTDVAVIGGGPAGAVAAIAAAVMAVFVWLAEKKRAAWVESFSIAGSMLAGMAAAVICGMIF